MVGRGPAALAGEGLHEAEGEGGEDVRQGVAYSEHDQVEHYFFEQQVFISWYHFLVFIPIIFSNER